MKKSTIYVTAMMFLGGMIGLVGSVWHYFFGVTDYDNFLLTTQESASLTLRKALANPTLYGMRETSSSLVFFIMTIVITLLLLSLLSDGFVFRKETKKVKVRTILGASLALFISCVFIFNSTGGFDLVWSSGSGFLPSTYLILITAATVILVLSFVNLGFYNREKWQSDKSKIAVRMFVLLLVSCVYVLFVNYLLTWSVPGSDNLWMLLIACFLLGGFTWFTFGDLGYRGGFFQGFGDTGVSSTVSFKAFLQGGIVFLSSAGLLLFVDKIWSEYEYYEYSITTIFPQSLFKSFLNITVAACLYAMAFLVASFLSLTFIPAKQPSKYRRSWAVKSTAAFIFLFVLATPLWIKGQQLHVDKYLKYTGIEQGSSETKTVLLLSSEVLENTAQSRTIGTRYLLDTSVIDRDDFEIPFTTQNMDHAVKSAGSGNTLYKQFAYEINREGNAALWNAESMRFWCREGADNSIWTRMSLLRQLRNIPPNNVALGYMEYFTDEGKWSYSGPIAEQIAEIYGSWGMGDQARMWARRAIDRDVDPENLKDISLENRDVLKNGSIRGRLTVNGVPLTGAKIGVFSDRYFFLFVRSSLVDDAELDENGTFTISGLLEGNYYIAVMANPEELPYDNSNRIFKFNNLPGTIALAIDAPKLDLGTIDISFENPVEG